MHAPREPATWGREGYLMEEGTTKRLVLQKSHVSKRKMTLPLVTLEPLVLTASHTLSYVGREDPG